MPTKTPAFAKSRLGSLLYETEPDSDLIRMNLPTDPALYRTYSKEIVYCLACYMQTNWTRLNNEIKKRITKTFDAEMPALPKPLRLYRGLVLHDYDELEPGTDFRNSDVLRFNRFLSTSHDRKFADDMTHDAGGPIKILYVLDTMAGARGLDTTDPELAGLLADWDKWGNLEQREVVLARGSKFKVVDKETNADDAEEGEDEIGADWELHLEQIK